MDKTLTIKKILDLTEKHFKKKGIDNARLEAEVLLSELLQQERLDLYMNFEKPLNDIEVDTYRDYVKQRSEHVPISYIIGRKEFYSLSFKVNEHTLIPRPETEILVDVALTKIKSRFDKKLKVLDIGTGCGNIAISIAAKSELVRVEGFDISQYAVDVARENAKFHKVNKKVKFFEFDINGDFYELRNKVGKADVIVSNPPYIKSSEIEDLAPEIKFHEPRSALDGGEDGLMYIGKIIHMANGLLYSKGYLIMEIGYDQADPVKTLAEKYFKVDFQEDLQGHKRVLVAYREK